MREGFHTEIEELLEQLVATGAVCDRMLEHALHALLVPGAPGAAVVVARDNDVDAAYQQVQQRLLGLFALQAPVASDLRLLAAMLHVNIHVERLGDYAAHVAKMAGVVSHLDEDPQLASRLEEMGLAACHVSRAALRSLADRDVTLARRLPELDDRVDALNLEIFRRLVKLAGEDERRLEWATHMIVVARSIERYGDHAVDIGEQTIYAVTGETVELSSNDPHATSV
jgi:phosphate transport system protein